MIRFENKGSRLVAIPVVGGSHTLAPGKSVDCAPREDGFTAERKATLAKLKVSHQPISKKQSEADKLDAKVAAGVEKALAEVNAANAKLDARVAEAEECLEKADKEIVGLTDELKESQALGKKAEAEKVALIRERDDANSKAEGLDAELKAALKRAEAAEAELAKRATPSKADGGSAK